MINFLDMVIPGTKKRVGDIKNRDELEGIVVSLNFHIASIQVELDEEWVAKENTGTPSDPEWLTKTRAEWRYAKNVVEALRLHGKTLKKASQNDHERKRQALFIECLREVTTPEVWLAAVEMLQTRFRAEKITEEGSP